jgi:acyl-CoA thioesterase-1
MHGTRSGRPHSGGCPLTRRLFAIFLASVWLLHGTATARAAEDDSCPTAPIPSFRLPVTKAAVAAGRPVVVVALGSSSSRGAAASDPAHSYPAVLQVELSMLLPRLAVSVVNRGNDGEDATQELARLGTDVIAVRPQLVIWQVGANGALRGTDPSVFRSLVTAGVTLVADAGADVILMDNQRAPQILHASARVAIEAAVADVARATNVSLFSRGAIMDIWRDRGFGYELFVGPDGLHHNDRGYRCIAKALSRAISAAVAP